MADYREAFVGIDVAKLRNAIAIAEGGREGEVRFRASPRALFDAIASEEFVLKRVIGQLAWQGPTQSDCRGTPQFILHRTARYLQYDRNLAGAGPASGKPKHLSCLMVSLLFAGIKMSSFIAR